MAGTAVAPRTAWAELILSSGRLAFTFQEAVDVTGVSIDVMQIAAKRGELRRVYPTSKPIILTPDFIEWLEGLPETPPERAPRKKK